jgi:hypothetical protein
MRELVAGPEGGEKKSVFNTSGKAFSSAEIRLKFALADVLHSRIAEDSELLLLGGVCLRL